MDSKNFDKLINFLIPENFSKYFFHNGGNESLPNNPVDFIIISSDFLKNQQDIHKFLLDIRGICHDRTRFIFVLKKFNSLFSHKDIRNFLIAGNFEVVTKSQNLFFHYLIARPLFWKQKDTSVSIVVPIRNEVKNIESIVNRIPKLGLSTEIILIEGGSTDGSKEECERVVNKYNKEKNVKLFIQSKKGKGNAVKEGIDASTGEIIFILDSDLVIPPEEFPYFYNAFIKGVAELLNATRLVYPLEKGSMPFINKWGNRFFGILYSYLLGQKLKDLFAGTKVFRKSDYMKIDALRNYFKTNDLWGDVDLLFGAAKLGLKIQDLPVHYYARLHGATNMNRYGYAWFLCKKFLSCRKKLKAPLF